MNPFLPPAFPSPSLSSCPPPFSNALNAILERYGQILTLQTDSRSFQVRAFFQSKPNQNPAFLPSPIGSIPQGQYLYLGPPNVDLQHVHTILWNGRTFHFIRTQPVCLGSNVLYQRGLAVFSDRRRKP